MAGIDIAEKRLPQDGRIKLMVDKQNIDFRVSTLPAYHGESVRAAYSAARQRAHRHSEPGL